MSAPTTPARTDAGAPTDAEAALLERVEAWVAWLGRTGLAAATKRSYTRQIRVFTVWIVDELAPADLADVIADPHVRDYVVRDYRRHLLTGPKLAPKSVDAALTAIAAWYEWLGLGRPDVALTAPRTDQSAPRALTEDQLRRVLRAAERAGPRDHAIIEIFAGAGLRVAELAQLDLDDMWATTGRGEVIVRVGKGDKPRTIPIGASTRRAYRRWLAHRDSWPALVDEQALWLSRTGHRLADRSIRHLIGRIGAIAGIDDLSPHTLRHTYGTRLVRTGVDIVTVAELMGHTNLETTRRYTRPSRDDTATAIDRIDLDY